MMNPRNFLFSMAFAVVLSQHVQAAEIEPQENFDSVEERRIENSIIEERANIRKEREYISLREKELKTLEDSVDKKLAEMDNKLEELRQQQKKIEALLAVKTEEEKKRTLELAKIYEKMSPDKAATSLSGLDQKLAADLLASMKVKAAAKILDQISKQKATELSTTFSTLQLE
ncbi:MAG: hypothetical protein A2X81_11705 [Desulfobacterales bacterium GWB2_56_26]|nr:MAG: hypothetical protein A2X81_11705 [Desulfobacterales bacterium GWB2_56_26]HBG20927.1 hypothetical protein [Desulfobulbaceae bacterium]